jgi:hypothetical protein
VRKLWSLLHRQVLGWLGGGVVLAGGVWVVVTFFYSPHSPPQAPPLYQETHGNSPTISRITGNVSITNDPPPRESGQ